jgi:hypothetical protein
MTADQRKELEALEAEMRREFGNYDDAIPIRECESWADRIAAVLADGVEEG